VTRFYNPERFAGRNTESNCSPPLNGPDLPALAPLHGRRQSSLDFPSFWPPGEGRLENRRALCRRIDFRILNMPGWGLVQVRLRTGPIASWRKPTGPATFSHQLNKTNEQL